MVMFDAQPQIQTVNIGKARSVIIALNQSAGVAQWQSNRLVSDRLWVRLPPPAPKNERWSVYDKEPPKKTEAVPPLCLYKGT